LINDWIYTLVLIWLIIVAIKSSYETKLYHDSIFKYRQSEKALKNADERIQGYVKNQYELHNKMRNLNERLDIAIIVLQNIDSNEARAGLKDIEKWKGER
jgi:NAD-dependent SIR2 family protein deacetylase